MDRSQTMDEDVQLLPDNHKPELQNRWRTLSRDRSRWWHVSHGAFEVLLLCMISILAIIILSGSRSRDQELQIPTVVPKFAQTIHFTHWEPDPSFVDPKMFTNPELQSRLLHDWLDRLLPSSRGFIEVPNAEEFNLAPPRIYHSDENPKYMITAFHQLHCVSYLIRAFSAARLRDPTFIFEDEHIIHCFDYLRQGIICAADSTLEGNNTSTDGVHHVCNNFDALKAWATENGAKNVPPHPYPG